MGGAPGSMARKSETPEAVKTRQRKQALQIGWRVIIVLIAAYTLAKFFKVPLPF